MGELPRSNEIQKPVRVPAHEHYDSNRQAAEQLERKNRLKKARAAVRAKLHRAKPSRQFRFRTVPFVENYTELNVNMDHPTKCSLYVW